MKIAASLETIAPEQKLPGSVGIKNTDSKKVPNYSGNSGCNC